MTSSTTCPPLPLPLSLRTAEGSERQAALFDMDGLLVDSEPMWTLAEQELAPALFGVFSPELKAAIVGTRLEVAVPTMLSWFGADTGPERVDETSRWLLARMVALFAQPVKFLPGAPELVHALRTEAVPVALVSSSYRVLMDAVLVHGAGPFDVTVAGDEVTRGKPDPEPYLTAARRLGVVPEQCVVLEDSPAGVAAAEAAGCAVVAVPSVATVEIAPGARRLVLPSLSGVSPDDLRRLVTA